MRAKGLIPAWVKAGLAIAASVTLLVVAALSIGSYQRNAACDELHGVVDLVAADNRVRSSDAYAIDLSRHAANGPLLVSRGEFFGAWTIDGLRTCLGDDWSETSSTADGAARGTGTVFVRHGGPLVIHQQSYESLDRHQKTRVIIEPQIAAPGE